VNCQTEKKSEIKYAKDTRKIENKLIFLFSWKLQTAVFKKQTRAELEKSRARVMQKFFFVFADFFLFCTSRQASGTQVWVLSDKIWVESQINLQLTINISLKQDSN